jgi:hypothetical protein
MNSSIGRSSRRRRRQRKSSSSSSSSSSNISTSNNYNTLGYYKAFEDGKFHCNFGE